MHAHQNFNDVVYLYSLLVDKGRTIRKVMGGGRGGPFPNCTIIFSKFLLVSIIFFLLIPCSNFIWGGGGGGGGGGLGRKIFLGNKNFFRT
jgi:hypothetical protein